MLARNWNIMRILRAMNEHRNWASERLQSEIPYWAGIHRVGYVWVRSSIQICFINCTWTEWDLGLGEALGDGGNWILYIPFLDRIIYSNARFLYRYHISSTPGGVDGIRLEESVLRLWRDTHWVTNSRALFRTYCIVFFLIRLGEAAIDYIMALTSITRPHRHLIMATKRQLSHRICALCDYYGM